MGYILNLFHQNRCVYCRNELDKARWNSTWGDHQEHHYKTIHCEKCRKHNWVKVNFPGSGHDPLFRQPISPLESTVRKVWEK